MCRFPWLLFVGPAFAQLCAQAPVLLHDTVPGAGGSTTTALQGLGTAALFRSRALA